MRDASSQAPIVRQDGWAGEEGLKVSQFIANINASEEGAVQCVLTCWYTKKKGTSNNMATVREYVLQDPVNGFFLLLLNSPAACLALHCCCLATFACLFRVVLCFDAMLCIRS